MRRTIHHLLSALLFVGALNATTQAQAVSPSDATANDSVDLPSGVEASPEMWMYLHEYKRYQDPKESVRSKAIARAKQRQARIESQKWYGHSKLRPNATAIPQMSVRYGHQWGGLAWDPQLWTPYATYYHYHRGGSGRGYVYPSVRVANTR
ncbi:MAG: hypothetical protein KDB27_27135 [Planctomycetales bacterium]|nr:hypothetical protein [Planctomycetales bacterium]